MTFILLSVFILVGRVVADTGPADYAELDPARNPATPLLQGSAGSEVVALQNALAGVTYAVEPKENPPTGIFDDATVAALEAFQIAMMVPSAEIGIVSVNTMEQFDLMLGIQACVSQGLARLTDAQVTSEISAGATAVLNDYWSFPIGTEIPFRADGHTYVGRIELHYHEYGGSMTPYGYHHGVSILYFQSDELMTGSEFLRFSESMSVDQREDYILLELARGNMPALLSKWQTVVVSATTEPYHNISLQVAPEYLSIGTNEDFVRIPCAAFTAQKLSNLFNTSVPTTRLVDLIWSAAKNKVNPQPISPSDLMCRNAYVLHENTLIESQLTNIDVSDRFVGGDKKDTVLTNQYESNPNSVAEYGWHQLNGEPIQPLYLGHSCDWADYSMGIRMINNSVLLDGIHEMTIQDILMNDTLARIISDEGVIRNPWLPINPRPAAECWVNPSVH